MKTALVTGAVGFIGFFTCLTLLKSGWKVIGIDSMNEYYDVLLKKQRENELLKWQNYQSIHKKIEEPLILFKIFQKEKPEIVIHLAAQAGVRYSIENPRSYLQSNIVGTFELLEAARAFPPEHMLLASTSSAYGANTNMPYCEVDKSDHQISFYAATKKSTENIAHSYAHLFNLPITMFRFFTVYGPWGRPDMALFKFTKAIFDNQPIDVYNNGEMKRDFTFIKDLVHAIYLLIDAAPVRPLNGNVTDGDSLSEVAPFRVVNIGNAGSVTLMEFIRAIEKATNLSARLNYLPIQPGDVVATCADVSLLKNLTGYTPNTSISDGVKEFVDWYSQHYKVKRK